MPLGERNAILNRWRKSKGNYKDLDTDLSEEKIDSLGEEAFPSKFQSMKSSFLKTIVEIFNAEIK